MAKVGEKERSYRPSRIGTIIATAIEVFGELGPDATLEDVAGRADMSTAAIFYHFDTKEALMAAAVEECASLVNVRVMDMWSSGAPMTSRDVMESLWDWAEAYPAHARLLYVWSVSGPPAVQQARQKFVEWYIKSTSKYFEGEPADPIEAAFRDLSCRTYMTFSMYCAEAWNAGWGVYGTTDKNRVLDEMALFRMHTLELSN